MSVPTRSWPSATDDEEPKLVIEETGPDDNCLVLRITPAVGAVVLDPGPTGGLVADLLTRLAVMAGRRAAVEAAASASIAALSGPDQVPDPLASEVQHEPPVGTVVRGVGGSHDGERWVRIGALWENLDGPLPLTHGPLPLTRLTFPKVLLRLTENGGGADTEHSPTATPGEPS